METGKCVAAGGTVADSVGLLIHSTERSAMKLEVRSGSQARSARRIAFVQSAAESVLAHTYDRIEGMTVSLNSLRRRNAVDEISCRIAAHVPGRGTVVAAAKSGSVYGAVYESLRKISRGLEHVRGRRRSRRRGTFRTVSLEPAR